MPGIARPVHVTANLEDRTSRLFFDGGGYADYFMRGGVCWPMTYTLEGFRGVMGFALMAGFEVRTGKITVFEQREFYTIEHVLNPDTGGIDFYGLGPWLNEVWNRYFARHYFWNQNPETNKRYFLETRRSRLVQPKPVFMDVHWSSDDDARDIVARRAKVGGMEIETESVLGEQIQAVSGMDKDLPPAVHALTCCLAGIERAPYRKREKEIS